jgi:hypothetical protein
LVFLPYRRRPGRAPETRGPNKKPWTDGSVTGPVSLTDSLRLLFSL